MKTGKALPGRARRWLGGAVAFLFAVQACAASAADGGYHVTAGGGVELEGGVIASTAAKDGNSLSADHLTFSDIANRSEASSSSLGISLGAAPDGKPGLPMPEVGQPAREQSTGTARATLTPGSLNLAHQTQDLAHLDTALAEANTRATRYDLERLKAKQQSAAALSELLNKAVGDFSGKLRLPARQKSFDPSTIGSCGQLARNPALPGRGGMRHEVAGATRGSRACRTRSRLPSAPCYIGIIVETAGTGVETRMSKPIEDYGLIGNMISAALVSRDGSIDWLCLPRFDSAACFAALVGDENNGRWRIAPEDSEFSVTRRYLPDTAVLETRFETPTGVATLTDFMPLTDDEERVDVVRIVKGVSGELDIAMELILRFGYGQAVPWVRQRDYGLSAVAGPDAVELHTRLPLSGKDMRTVARFKLREGDRVPMTLSYHLSHQKPHFVPDRGESLDRTTTWWREWVKGGRLDRMPARWRATVIRSLITLKLLTFQPTGGIVAAPTTSLPEFIGGSRNWDYRYCWLRDSALTLYALLNAGHRREADDWRQWLLRAVAGHPLQLQIMYGIGGERWLPEVEVPWLDGYENSRPVRLGNGAANQMQLDVYGELIDALHAAREAELQPHGEAWNLQLVLLDHLEETWQKPDRGIWEIRGEPKAFTHSRMMCWMAFDRAVKSVEQFGLEGPVDKWRTIRDAIHADICEKGFDHRKKSFTQYYGGTTLDASLLLMPQIGFLKPDDPRLAGTVAAIERELLRGGFVRRYSTDGTDDGVGGDEGAFLACSFWLADAYILTGRKEDARDLFERLVGLGNDLGLLAEEYDVTAGRMVGNFPQAFSHIGLINTAHNLVKASGPARQRSGQPEAANDRNHE